MLKIEASNCREHGAAEGTIRWISDNAFTLDDDGKPIDAFYKARFSISALNFANVPAKLQLIWGMTLQADVNVGSRSMAMSLLGGILRGFSEATPEP